jgi:hypothetical protein
MGGGWIDFDQLIRASCFSVGSTDPRTGCQNAFEYRLAGTHQLSMRTKQNLLTGGNP